MPRTQGARSFQPASASMRLDSSTLQSGASFAYEELTAGSWWPARCDPATRSGSCRTKQLLTRVVLPGLPNTNLSAVVKTDEISLAAKHVKVRRAGYGERLINVGESSDAHCLDAVPLPGRVS